jgi:2-keto-3-deoxy-L-rhamnonate aldolase RhmA
MSANRAMDPTGTPVAGGNGKAGRAGRGRNGARKPVFRSITDAKRQAAADVPADVLDIFRDDAGSPRRLRGIAVYTGALKLAELAARIGFETIWIEMEHGPADFTQVESLCMAIEAGGGIPTVRIPDGQRNHVLRALEVGARILVVPMINTAEQAEKLVEYGKFPPLGSRGYNVRSRGVEYGLNGAQLGFSRANQRTHLFAQIETAEAVSNLDAICQVEGMSGIFIGPGDLSVSLGCPADLEGKGLIDVVCDCIRRARAFGLHAGILVPPGRMLTAAVEAGCDLLFYGGDVTELSKSWPKLLAQIEPKVAHG